MELLMPRALSRSFRLDAETVELLELVGKKLGQTHTGVVRLAVRRLAEAERIKRPAQEGAKPHGSD